MEKMPGHPRLYRHGATYYHRAAIPVDIADTYPKTEEMFSLRVKDYREALKLVRIEAARVDQLFDEHRRKLALQAQPALQMRKESRDCDYDLYKERHLVERFSNRIKHFRAIATSYAKRARNFKALLQFVATIVWMVQL